ncbi:hypothetical protein D3C85_1642540 [compost metagenome]
METREHFQAVQPRNADVEDDQVRQAFADHLHGVYAVVRFTDHSIAFILQKHAHRQADDRVIVDDEDRIHVELSIKVPEG